MKSILASISLFALAACGSAQDGATETTPASTEAVAEDTGAETTEAAPVEASTSAFTLQDVNGTDVSLSDYAGKTVVLEWFNPGCPFIVHAHTEGPLKEMIPRVTADESVVWLAINSSAKGQGADLEFNKSNISEWGIETPVLMDPTGAVGHAFGAKTTPHMFILDGDANIVYQGALDNAPRGEGEGEYVNYVEAALANLKAGEPVATAETKSYGCSVKY